MRVGGAKSGQVNDQFVLMQRIHGVREIQHKMALSKSLKISYRYESV